MWAVPGEYAASAQVAEWLMAADCKSAALCATEVRILPCAPLVLKVASGERCGSKPGGQRKNVDLAVRAGRVSDFGLADDGAR